MKGTIWLVESHLKFIMRRLMNYSWVRMFTSDLTHEWWRAMNVSESTVGYRRCPLSGSRNLPLLSTGIFRKIYLYIITAFLKILKIRFPLLLFYLSLYDIKECVICNDIDIRKYFKKLSKLFCNWLGFFHFFYVSIT
jgi:hypothetical protein